MKQAQRIVFAGSPDFAVAQLDALHDAGLPLVGVLSQPDRPAGRKRRLQSTAVTRRAHELGLPVATPASLRKEEGIAALRDFDPDLLVVAAYGLILPRTALDLPALGCLNVHASMLPRWRGAAPVERAMIAGDRRTGVCIMQMDAGLDTGAVRLARDTPIDPEESGGELESRLAVLGAQALLEVLADLDACPARTQSEVGVTYADKLTRADAVLDLTESADALARRIRALNPRLPPSISTTEGGTSVQWLRARAIAGQAPPGRVQALDRDGLCVGTGEGLLQITELRVVGGKGTVLSGADLANALRDRLSPGSVVSSA